ncbi:phenylacetate--CoA ligase family protein [Massilia psychrophila]|uniref:phenylacetate--CoA ligase family protein n=1 Tax=Massilia psychrophila TaxID=1603353 RepID=UPI00117EC799|nr:phenylacetate--CoA ligase family protein [Massilia psychrophila]
MTSPLRNELLFGTRALLRDTPWSQWRLRALQRNEAMSHAEFAAVQASLLHKTLRTAIARLPFYAHIRRDFPVAASVDVLRAEFPIIDKATLLANRRSLYPNGGVKQPWQALGATSGTTGAPLEVFRSVQSVLMEQAFVKRHWAWGGYHDGMVRASLRGDLVADTAVTKPPFWFWNRYNRQLLVSSRHLTEANADAIIDRLEALAPAMLQAYPSTAFTLAGLLQRRGRRLHIARVFTSSEPSYAHQRELIRDRLGATIMDLYGMAERVAFASACEHGQLHVNADYAYVEIVDGDGRPTDGEGDVVGTTFHNHAMPLVRYRMGDRSRWKPGPCPCGRVFPIIEGVSGKYLDAITGSDGAPVSPSVLTFAFKRMDQIRKSQVAQVGPASWEVRVVPLPGFTAFHQQYLIDIIHRMVDPHVLVKVVLRDDLPNTAAGKFRWVVNEYANNNVLQPPGNRPE